MVDAYIFDAVRTPRGKGRVDGSLHDITALSLTVQMLKALETRNGLDTRKIDDVILGCVTPIGEEGQDIARTAVLTAGWDYSVGGVQINRFCSSGLEACNMAAAKVVAGEADMVVAGGIESMSRVGIGTDGGAWPIDPTAALASYFAPQGVSADLIATLGGYSRRDVDAFALESQKRAAVAWKEGRFRRSIIPVLDQAGAVRLDHDEHMRPESSIEGLGALNPAFAGMGALGFDAVVMQRYPEVAAIDHVHTAGNSSGIVDGAAGVLIGSKAAGKALGLKPRARIKAMAAIGSEPSIMLTGPAEVTRKLMRKAKLRPEDVDLYEVNEAFAAVVLRYMRELSLDPAKVNVNGGAIALGHPLGATGAMILGTALDEIERTDRQNALITLCVGAGMGVATFIERV
ncbi:MAG: 3-ketoacyl-CoA thiolase [Caulobacteraceae bacterium]|nr:3-ketoacyl-CoA thiolase [Caulobacteraceae bacterium]